MITYQIAGVSYRIKNWKFPAGEVGCMIPFHNAPQHVKCVSIKASIQSSDELMQLFMVTDSIRRLFTEASIELYLGYTPYGRQDRVCNEGESLSIKVFASLINSQCYDKVVILDPHSDVTTAVFDKVAVVPLDKVFFDSMKHKVNSEYVFVAPDAGAAKKVKLIADKFGADCIFGIKTRNMSDGSITDLVLSGDVSDKKVIVVDDICDAGATFLKLAEILKQRNVKSMDLFVTHGIFTKGTECLTSVYNTVYTTNSYHQDREGVVDGVNYFKYF
jgi:ribose-phosphate pyrophosphokinase